MALPVTIGTVRRAAARPGDAQQLAGEAAGTLRRSRRDRGGSARQVVRGAAIAGAVVLLATIGALHRPAARPGDA